MSGQGELRQRRTVLERQWATCVPELKTSGRPLGAGLALRHEVSESWARSVRTVDPARNSAPVSRQGVHALWSRSPLYEPVNALADDAGPLPADEEPAGQLLPQEARVLLMASDVDGTGAPARVELTPAAQRLVQQLGRQHGPLMFHQSGGYCDGSSPMCYPRGEFRVGAADVLLAEVAEQTPFWMSASQYAYWKHTHLTVEVVEGRGSGFSLEAPEGVRFLLRSRLLTDEELAALDAQPPPPTGDSVASGVQR